MNRKFRQSVPWALAFGFLAGCGTPTHLSIKPDEAQVRQFAGRGYLTDDRFGIATTYASWQNGKGDYEVALTVPAQPGRYPLVIYLPALGEDRTAGEAWRSSWARAGYVVLSLQPLAEDARAWSSPRARTGDFTLLARERYSDQAMSARLQALQGALLELARRQAANEAPLDRVDLSNVAVAGFDLGAFTAMAIAGEELRNVVIPPLAVSIRAVIALSPYASFSGPSFTSRYRAIRLPVLALTGDGDADPLGLVPSPDVRRAPFEYMPPGDKYLALLAGMPHRSFGGGNLETEEEPDGRPAEYGNSIRGTGSSGGRGGSGGHGHFSAAGSHSHGGGGVQADGGEAGHAVSRQDVGQRLSATELAMGVASIQGISTAFLDAVLKQDAIALEWLTKDAGRWLGSRGELRRK